MTYVPHYAPDNASPIICLAVDHSEVPSDTALVDRALATRNAVAADLPAGFGSVLPPAMMSYLWGCLRWCARYPTDHSRDWFDLATYTALAQLWVELEALPCTRALQTAKRLGQTAFTNPTYANPPFGSAT
ncbi:hypothetical protein ABMC88_06150 [Sulfitobacter sp. HNIBRBA2951]|uniref:hypothetical protein n=1 Tax=Sulfitobacter aquimarinus TaxID=3158557 RepID=UPI0032DFCC47